MQSTKSSATVSFFILVALAVFILLRARWMGHLLMWDEAMNICSTRAFAAGGHDAYSGWFWRYPPIMNLLLCLLKPLAPGFIARAEWVPLLISVATFFALARFNQSFFGPSVALISAVALAVMPGSVFFSLWIKQDGLAALMGLLAIWATVRGRWIPAGILLGIALLAKQTAAFHALTIAILLATRRQWKPLLIIAAISAVTSLWWYFLFSTSDRQFFNFFATGSDNAAELWKKPWYFYFIVLWRDVGFVGCVFAVLGFIKSLPSQDDTRWPAILSAVGFGILTISGGKTIWYPAILYPAIATLIAIGACALWSWATERLTLGRGPLAFLATIVLAASTAMPVVFSDYESNMELREPGMWDASFSSKQAADALNARVADGQRALITPMHYYGPEVTYPCPIFAAYLKDMPLIIRPNTLTESQFIEAVRDSQISWAMVSPPPQSSAQLLGPLYRGHKLRLYVFRNTVVINTNPLRTSTEAAHGSN